MKNEKAYVIFLDDEAERNYKPKEKVKSTSCPSCEIRPEDSIPETINKEKK
jgi:hypothetical protein